MTILKYIFSILVTIPIFLLGVYLLRRYTQEIKANAERSNNNRKKNGGRR